VRKAFWIGGDRRGQLGGESSKEGGREKNKGSPTGKGKGKNSLGGGWAASMPCKMTLPATQVTQDAGGGGGGRKTGPKRERLKGNRRSRVKPTDLAMEDLVREGRGRGQEKHVQEDRKPL